MVDNIIFKRWVYILIIILTSSSLILINYKSPFVIIPFLIGIIFSITAIFCIKIKKLILLSVGYIFFSIIFSGTNFLSKYGIYINYYMYMLPLFIFILSYMYITNSYDKSIKYCTFIESILVSFSTIEIYFLNKNIYICFLFIFYCITSFLVSNLLAQNLLLRNRYYETSSQFEKEETSMKAMYNSMISSQDEKIENAILSERNRISRDIHDSLGHLTSRGILQIGAMIVTEKNESRKKQLMDLKDTLSDGMNEVRKSLHNFQNESIDLHNELENIVDSFDFCKLDFTYSITSELSLKEKYSIIYIIKESLTNIAKHWFFSLLWGISF